LLTDGKIDDEGDFLPAIRTNKKMLDLHKSIYSLNGFGTAKPNDILLVGAVKPASQDSHR
jgi:hypothetical protein